MDRLNGVHGLTVGESGMCPASNPMGAHDMECQGLKPPALLTCGRDGETCPDRWQHQNWRCASSEGGAKQQSEKDLLLQDFSCNLSALSYVLFFENAFIVSAIPIWLYWRMWHMDSIQSAVLYSEMTLVSTYLMAFAYKNVKFVLKHKLAQKREDAVSKEVTRKLSEADNRKMSRKENERILWKKNEVADYEATTFSIFYNNTLFLGLVIVASFFIPKNFNPMVNYILSISTSSGPIVLPSTGSK
ncbi:translocon-associated protein subunit gamma-like [Perognathus longimembris pacificus]|uniref:translocon-associated protein subunit gamma-like n=1 Tax=Perognathus longimembris pacificus TaxID=214514 RepID=UPI00201999EB|nr:translocon-associated protein subunit gamma-like [Perognathus longimembris pacificus]